MLDHPTHATDHAAPGDPADPTDRTGRRAPGTPLRRALAAELRVNAPSFRGTAVLALLSLALAAVATDALSQLAVLWAALAWYRYGRDDTNGRQELWASLGLTRADRVRGRIALVGLESTLLLVIGMLGTVVTLAAGHEPTFRGDAYTQGPLAVALLGGLLANAALLLVTGAVVGGECTTRRPGTSMFPLTILTTIGSALLLGLVSFLIVLPVGLALGNGAVTTWTMAGVSLLLSALGALYLRHEARRWIRSLDAGDPRRRRARGREGRRDHRSARRPSGPGARASAS